MPDNLTAEKRRIAHRLFLRTGKAGWPTEAELESALDAYAALVCAEKDKWRTAALLKARTREAIWDRYGAGDSVETLAADYDVPVEWVAAIVNPGFDLSQQRESEAQAEIARLRKALSKFGWCRRKGRSDG